MARSSPTPDWSSAVYRVACPRCLQHPNHLIDPKCIPCEGTGMLALGFAALRDFTPEAVARAITQTLDSTEDEEQFVELVFALDSAGVLDLDSDNA